MDKDSPKNRTCPESKNPHSQSRRSRPHSIGWHSRGYLPHFDIPGLVQHITFHLADSLPADAITCMQQQLESMPEPKRAIERRKRIETLFDSGLGACILRQDDCAGIMEDSLRFGDGSRYRLLAWVIMPNHVHVLIEQLPGWALPKVVQSWKRHTARQFHRRADPQDLHQKVVWQRDYWDRFIRDERHFVAAKRYIEDNPVAAGLVPSAEAWPWGSARDRRVAFGLP